ncbi:MAG: TetR/AcrR family transcriptional regulator [Nevskiales bacterium]|nr:TetR/AcrR family transcriptional regulator [Nevskiales bacterium]
MTAPPSRSQRPRSLAAERAILSATLRILAEDGYAGLTIDRVAATARASKSTIYRRWKNKEHLILALFERLPVAMPEAGDSFEAELLSAFRQFARIMDESPLRGVLPMLVAECVNNPALAAALAKVNDRRRVPLRQIIERAVERGELVRGTDVELVIDVLQGAIAIRLYFLLDQVTEDWIRSLVQLIRDGAGRRER